MPIVICNVEMYEEGDYDMMSPDSAAAVDYTQTFSDIFTNCIIPNISGVTDSITPLLIACLMCWLVSRLASSRPAIVHCFVTMAGAGVLYKFFMANSLILGKWYYEGILQYYLLSLADVTQLLTDQSVRSWLNTLTRPCRFLRG